MNEDKNAARRVKYREKKLRERLIDNGTSVDDLRTRGYNVDISESAITKAIGYILPTVLATVTPKGIEINYWGKEHVDVMRHSEPDSQIRAAISLREYLSRRGATVLEPRKDEISSYLKRERDLLMGDVRRKSRLLEALEG